jgi:hypothetical protein
MGLDKQIMMYPELAKISCALLYGKVSLHAQFSLKEAAPLSISLIFVTDDTSHDKTFPLKEVAPKNIRITHTPPRNAFKVSKLRISLTCQLRCPHTKIQSGIHKCRLWHTNCYNLEIFSISKAFRRWLYWWL